MRERGGHRAVPTQIVELIVMFSLRLIISTVSLAISASVIAAPEREELAQEYRDLARCIQRVMGNRWEERFGIELTTNRHGVLEATGDSMDHAPQIVRITDYRCRRQVGLQGKSRP